MGVKTKVLIDNEWVNGEEKNFEVVKEGWNIYKLEDGTELHLKVVVTKVIQTEKYHPQRNDPIYSVSSKTIVDAIVPDELKRKS